MDGADGGRWSQRESRYLLTREIVAFPTLLPATLNLVPIFLTIQNFLLLVILPRDRAVLGYLLGSFSFSSLNSITYQKVSNCCGEELSTILHCSVHVMLVIAFHILFYFLTYSFSWSSISSFFSFAHPFLPSVLLSKSMLFEIKWQLLIREQELDPVAWVESGYTHEGMIEYLSMGKQWVQQ